MLDRLLIVIALAILGLTLYRWYTARQLQQINLSKSLDPILAGLRTGVPAVVYFTTPNCVPCKIQQQPALERLRTQLGDDIQIVQIDATQEPDTAERWGVMSAPTTFILDETGTPKAVNHGYADERKITQQLQAITDVA